MNKKAMVAIALALLLTLLLASPVLSQEVSGSWLITGDLTHSKTYEFEGQISLEKQAGHLCNTGAEMKQVISGYGKLDKTSEIYMKGFFIDVMDSNSFITAPDALSNLTVVTAIELCSPPKYIFAEDFERGLFKKGDVVPLALMVDEINTPWGWYGLNDLLDDELIEPLTKQIWATSVSANPGQMGNYTGGFKAAYGPYDDSSREYDHAWWFVDEDGDLTYNLTEVDSASWGEDFVGNYFGIEQFAYTSGGVTKRYTSISSPFSHAYFMNDLTVTGMASITEAFTMGNLDEGTAAATDWWDLF